MKSLQLLDKISSEVSSFQTPTAKRHTLVRRRPSSDAKVPIIRDIAALYVGIADFENANNWKEFGPGHDSFDQFIYSYQVLMTLRTQSPIIKYISAF